MTFLLDVNVLIALIDPMHVAHEEAHDWFGRDGHRAWASCPLTENGVIRILGHPKYPNSPGSPAAVAQIVATMRRQPGHTFWPDDISLVGTATIDTGKIVSAKQVTDTYLLALAAARGARLATLDRRLSPAAVAKGQQALFQVGLTAR